MILNPSNLELLIHCHVTPEQHPRGDAPAIKEGIHYLLKEGMIERYDRSYTTTKKGQFYIEHLLSLPFPVEHTTYVIPKV